MIIADPVHGEIPIFALGVLAGSPSTVLAGSSGGIFKSTDGGGTWTQTLVFGGAFAFTTGSSVSTIIAGGIAGPPGATQGT